jgi:hypothetical protein
LRGCPKHIQPRRIEAAQIAAPQALAMTIETFRNMERKSAAAA